jgi:peptidoglycan/xylan/chitin deacetylase (PgdA/CDA1 family)
VLLTFKDRWAPRICTSVPFAMWHWISGVKLIVPHWHVVSDLELPHVSALYRFRSIRQFKADLEFFLKHYSPVTEQDVISSVHHDRPLPPRSVLFTFDDGFREIHDVVAPLLRAKGVPAIFFLITSAIDNRLLCYPQKKSLLVRALAGKQTAAALDEARRVLSSAPESTNSSLGLRIRAVSYRQRHVLDRLGPILGCDFEGYLASEKPYLSTEQVQTLARQGFAVGAHSVHHAPYAELSLEEQLHETRDSIQWLSERFEVNCRSFAFPYRDNGVPLAFFRAIFAEGDLKLSFGTGGLIPHAFPFNLPRFSTERTDLTAAEVLAAQFGRSVVRWTLGVSWGVSQSHHES